MCAVNRNLAVSISIIVSLAEEQQHTTPGDGMELITILEKTVSPGDCAFHAVTRDVFERCFCALARIPCFPAHSRLAR